MLSLSEIVAKYIAECREANGRDLSGEQEKLTRVVQEVIDQCGAQEMQVVAYALQEFIDQLIENWVSQHGTE